MHNEVSRRNFLKTSAALAAGVAQGPALLAQAMEMHFPRIVASPQLAMTMMGMTAEWDEPCRKAMTQAGRVLGAAICAKNMTPEKLVERKEEIARAVEGVGRATAPIFMRARTNHRQFSRLLHEALDMSKMVSGDALALRQMVETCTQVSLLGDTVSKHLLEVGVQQGILSYQPSNPDYPKSPTDSFCNLRGDADPERKHKRQSDYLILKDIKPLMEENAQYEQILVPKIAQVKQEFLSGNEESHRLKFMWRAFCGENGTLPTADEIMNDGEFTRGDWDWNQSWNDTINHLPSYVHDKDISIFTKVRKMLGEDIEDIYREAFHRGLGALAPKPRAELEEEVGEIGDEMELTEYDDSLPHYHFDDDRLYMQQAAEENGVEWQVKARHKQAMVR